MKTIAFPVFLVLLIFLATAFAPVKKGYKYTSAKGKMSVTFPAEFEIEENSGDKSHPTTKISSTMGDLYFMTAFTEHNTELTESEALAEASLKSFNEQLSGEIAKKSEWVLKGSKGLQAIINVKDQNIMVEYRVVMRGTIQYQVVAILRDSGTDQKVVDRYFKSFKIK